METKWRVDFYYWKKDSGFSHIETFDQLDCCFWDAKTYLEETDIDTSNMNCDAIWVKIVDNENDYVVDDYWWNLKSMYIRR